VSGCAAKTSPVTPYEDTHLAHEALGFARFDLTPNEIWIQFCAIKPDSIQVDAAGQIELEKVNDEPAAVFRIDKSPF
jgi:hypothetical protein